MTIEPARSSLVFSITAWRAESARGSPVCPSQKTADFVSQHCVCTIGMSRPMPARRRNVVTQAIAAVVPFRAWMLSFSSGSSLTEPAGTNCDQRRDHFGVAEEAEPHRLLPVLSRGHAHQAPGDDVICHDAPASARSARGSWSSPTCLLPGVRSAESAQRNRRWPRPARPHPGR